MKRVLTFLAIMLLPLSVWAMTPVTDSDLADVTGQAGVNINANLTMDISIGTMAWGDADGISGVYNNWDTIADGGYVGVTGFNIDDLKIRARVESNDSFNYYSTLMLKPITIDVATGPKVDVTGDATFVRFGLGALQIGMNELQFNVALGARAGTSLDGTNDLGAGGLDQVMGVVTLGPMEIYINPWSYVDIYAHDGCGVSFDMNVILDRITLGYASWGDTDGLPGGDFTPTGDPADPYQVWMAPLGASGGAFTEVSAGYVGLRDFNLGDLTSPAITIDGTVAIDVTTTALGTYSILPGLTQYLIDTYGMDTSSEAAVLAVLATPAAQAAIAWFMDPANYAAARGVYGVIKPVSVVHISFPEVFNMNVAKITANVAVGNNAALVNDGLAVNPALVSANMGDIYIEKMNLAIQTGSWVDIWAH